MSPHLNMTIAQAHIADLHRHAIDARRLAPSPRRRGGRPSRRRGLSRLARAAR